MTSLSNPFTDPRASKTEKFASISVATAGDNTIVAAVGGKKLKVSSYIFLAADVVTARWKDGAGTNLSGIMSLGQYGGAAMVTPTPTHVLETGTGQGLVLNLGGNIQVSGHVAYYEE